MTGVWQLSTAWDTQIPTAVTSKRLAWRVCDDLFGENVVSDEALEELAKGLRDNDLDMKWAFETVLNSELFFSDANLKTRIAPPETYVLGSLIALNTEVKPASTLALAEIFTLLGRSLFDPPNVGGWDGGRLWLNARTLVARSNFVNELINNGVNRTATAPNFDAVVDQFEDNKNLESVTVQFCELLLGIDRDSEAGRSMISVAKQQAEQQPKTKHWSHISHLLLNSSSAQLC